MDVFYEEFIKFIPPYILKREEEKRKLQEKGLANGSKLKAMTGTGINKGGEGFYPSSSALSNT